MFYHYIFGSFIEELVSMAENMKPELFTNVKHNDVWTLLLNGVSVSDTRIRY